MHCNGVLRDAAKEEVFERLPPLVQQHFDRFARCAACGHVYWAGTHYPRLQELVQQAESQSAGADSELKRPS
jgi:uncharacterized protein with PIN domain